MRLPLFAAVLLSASPLAAYADTITTHFSVGFTDLTGTAEDLFGVAQFNPALGTLNSISGTLTGNVNFVAGNPGSSFYELTLDGFAEGSLFRQSYTTSSAIHLSGIDTEDIGEFTGINHVLLFPDVLVVDGSASTVPASLMGTVTYNYTPAGASTPEPNGFVLLGTGLGVAEVMRRRLAGGR